MTGGPLPGEVLDYARATVEEIFELDWENLPQPLRYEVLALAEKLRKVEP